MTKEQLYVKWLMTPDLKSDIEAVIAHEIAKALELKKQFQQKADEALELNSKIGNFGNPKQPTEQPAKPFDKERFEAMFRAVIETHEATMNSLKQLDAYYATKNN